MVVRRWWEGDGDEEVVVRRWWEGDGEEVVVRRWWEGSGGDGGGKWTIVKAGCMEVNTWPRKVKVR